MPGLKVKRLKDEYLYQKRPRWSWQALPRHLKSSMTCARLESARAGAEGRSPANVIVQRYRSIQQLAGDAAVVLVK